MSTPLNDLVCPKEEQELADYSSDSEQDSNHIKAFVEATLNPTSSSYGTSPSSSSEQDLEKIIKEINANLAAGKNIDLSKYPPLFVVNFRGVHLFKDFFKDSEARKQKRHSVQSDAKESTYSPAIYELAKLKVGEKIDTKEKAQKIVAAKKELKKRFKTLEKESSTAGWWSGARNFSKQIYAHYQRFVNTYKDFRTESKKRGPASCYKTMDCSANPYISTADGALHAALYALGGKAELSHGVLRPAYINKESSSNVGRAKHPKTGYVEIIFHSLDSLKRNNPLFLSALHAEDEIDINDRTFNERETTFKGYISHKHIVKRRIVRFPSFNIYYDPTYHDKKYGIAKKSYTQYSNAIKQQKKNTTLPHKLAEHYAHLLQEEAKKIAADKGGFIVYLGVDGKLQKNLPTNLDIRTDRKNKQLAHNQALSVELPLYQNLNRYHSTENDTDDEEELKSFETKELPAAQQLKLPQISPDKKPEKTDNISCSLALTPIVADKNTMVDGMNHYQKDEEKALAILKLHPELESHSKNPNCFFNQSTTENKQHLSQVTVIKPDVPASQTGKKF